MFERLWLDQRVPSIHTDLGIGSFTGIRAPDPSPPACNWDTLVDAYNSVTRDVLAEPEPGHPRVIDQDGNSVRPPTGRLRDLGSA